MSDNNPKAEPKLTSIVTIKTRINKSCVGLEEWLGSNEDLTKTVEEMIEGNDRTKVVLAGAWIECLINALLSKYFDHDKSLAKKSLSHSGFLGSFSSKITLCYLQGLITKKENDELQKFVKLRNAYAHKISRKELDGDKDHLSNYKLYKDHFASEWKNQPPEFVFLFVFVTLKTVLENAITTCQPILQKK